MVNTKKKGQRKELLCQKTLQKEGWEVVFRSLTVKRGPCYVGIDFADLFDLVATKQEHRYWKFVSVKHAGSGHDQHRQQIKLFAIKNGLPGSFFELWIWYPSKYYGRGKNKIWKDAHFEREVVAVVTQEQAPRVIG